MAEDDSDGLPQLREAIKKGVQVPPVMGREKGREAVVKVLHALQSPFKAVCRCRTGEKNL